jgi:predicted KAP-like P-loop ATPase
MQSWQGKRVDRAFFQKAHTSLPPELVARLDTAERLAPFMTSAVNIHGNPRLIKRFLNALSMRMSISSEHGVGVDEAALAKMLLFERCGDAKAYAALTSAVVNSDEGKAEFLAKLEDDARAGNFEVLPAPWGGEFEKDWLTINPPLKGMDLRGILYVSREHAPIVSTQDRLSSEAVELLAAVLAKPKQAGSMKAKLQGLSKQELSIVMDRLLGHAMQEQSWGTPDILEACLTVAELDEAQGARLAGFLMERPPAQVKASIVPKIGAAAWAAPVLAKWKSAAGIAGPVKKAIEQKG